MKIENISTLKINRLTQEQYEKAKAEDKLSDSELYFTPASPTGGDIDITEYAYSKTEVDDKIANIDIPETNLSNYYTKDQTYSRDEADAAFMTQTEVDNRINALIVASDPKGGKTITDIQNLVKYVDENAGEITGLVNDVNANKQAIANMQEEIVSGKDEFHIVDDNGYIVATIDKDGVHSVAAYVESVPEADTAVPNKKYVDDAFAEIEGAEGYGTRGLEYTLSTDGTTYSCKGIGTATDVKHLVIPYTYKGLPVVSIGLTAFQNNTVIESVSIPDSVTNIETGAFAKCSNLRKVTVGNGLFVLGKRAFQECASLTEVILPEGLVTIGLNAFVKCTALERVYIPKSTTAVGTTQFTNCTNLTVYCGSSATASNWNSSWNDANRPVVWGVSAPTETNVLTANALKSEYKYSNTSLNTSNISVTLTTGRIYAVTFYSASEWHTATIMPVASGITRSTAVLGGNGVMHGCSLNGNQLSFYNSSGSAITVTACYIREI